MSHEAAALILLLIYHLLKRTDNSCHSLPIETQQGYPLQRTKRPQQYSSREAAGRLHLRLVVLPPLVGLLGDLVTPDANSFNTEIPRIICGEESACCIYAYHYLVLDSFLARSTPKTVIKCRHGRFRFQLL